MSPAVKNIILRSSVITPDRLPGLAAWYSADYGVLTSVGPDVAATDGQTVRRWLDRSGNGRHLDQATLAQQPTLTAGRLVFTRVFKTFMEYSTGGIWSFAGAGSILCVVKLNTALANNYGAVIAQYTGAGTSLYWAVQDYPNVGVRHTLDAFGNRSDSKNAGATGVETAESFVWDNWQTGSGISGATGRSINTITSTGTGSPSSLPSAPIRVGVTTTAAAGVDQYLDGSVAEIVACTAAVAPTALAVYFFRKYGTAL